MGHGQASSLKALHVPCMMPTPSAPLSLITAPQVFNLPHVFRSLKGLGFDARWVHVSCLWALAIARHPQHCWQACAASGAQRLALGITLMHTVHIPLPTQPACHLAC